MLLLATTSKEAPYVTSRSPPRPPIDRPQLATVVPLDQLWTRVPPARRQEVLGQLARILAKQLARPIGKEGADE